MADGISLTLGGDALLYLEAKAKELLGKDPKSRARRDEINRLQRLSLAQASSVQCVGMAQPIPIDQIYQPTRLRFEGPQTTFETRLAALKHKQQARKQASDVVSPAERRATTTVSQLSTEQKDAIILAGPGYGKTTLLHWEYMSAAQRH